MEKILGERTRQEEMTESASGVTVQALCPFCT